MNLEAMRILVLDDDLVTLELLAGMLSNLGFTDVTICDSGRQALGLLDDSAHATDLILLDLNMPGMDGVEFLRELEARRFAGSVMLTSGEGEEVLESVDTLVRARSIRTLGHLRKPVAPDALAAMIEQWRPGARTAARPARKTYGSRELRRAIANRELVNHYQPKVEIASGEVVGVETLVRWRHPNDGLVYPDQFIAVAEEHDLIEDLTRVVAGDALAAARRWLDEGLGLHVAVNVSMVSLASLEFPDAVSDQVAAAGVPAANVIFEITETRLMPKLTTVLDVLTRLRLKRFRLSIDDFGTGHSSLAQLRDIPFDELKVDRGFVHGAAANDKKRAICHASLRLARELGIAVVAEGIESPDDWRLLADEGCDYAQGFLIARPMPAEEIPAWIERWQARSRGAAARGR